MSVDKGVSPVGPAPALTDVWVHVLGSGHSGGRLGHVPQRVWRVLLARSLSPRGMKWQRPAAVGLWHVCARVYVTGFHVCVLPCSLRHEVGGTHQPLADVTVSCQWLELTDLDLSVGPWPMSRGG